MLRGRAVGLLGTAMASGGGVNSPGDRRITALCDQQQQPGWPPVPIKS